VDNFVDKPAVELAVIGVYLEWSEIKRGIKLNKNNMLYLKHSTIANILSSQAKKMAA